MCYAKKIVGINYEDREMNLGEEFDGKFDCTKFNCRGCNGGFVDGEAPKRN